MTNGIVEVFKTDVQKQEAAHKIVCLLNEQLNGAKINFDFGDCDRILRIETRYIQPAAIINLLQQEGYQCSLLD